MDRLKETQLTQRASRRPCEYNYTNADIHHEDVQPADGYQFEYPVNWTGDPSTHKVIGLRRINYKAPSVNLAFEFQIYYEHEGESGTESIPIVAYYTSENTFEEIIVDINKKITDKLEKDNLDGVIILSCMYDKDTGDVNLHFENKDGSETLEFYLLFPYGLDGTYSSIDDFDNVSKTYYKREFLKLFNQEVTKQTVYNLYNASSGYITQIHYLNVWNRDTFYCHASFSDSPRKIIGINKDFWENPSVFYEYSDNSNDFNIYFTTDTVHRILPRNGVLLIQISYIFNYQTSYLTY